MRKKSDSPSGARDEGLVATPDSQPASIFDAARVQVLPDGRVEAAIRDNEEKPVDELIGRISQAKAAKFIFNDLCPDVLDAAKTGKPFGQG